MHIFEGTWPDKFWQKHKGFIFYLLRRIKREQIQVIAGYLSYVCLMSLVPLVVVMLSVMTVFPIFSDLKDVAEQFVYQHFVPAASDVVKNYLSGFVDNASKMSLVAVSFLFVAALLLISTIDSTFNKIWRVHKKRRTMTSFAMYWMVLTLGPILVGASLAISSYILSMVSVEQHGLLGLSNFLIRLLPLLASVLAFLILYMAVPNKTVPFKAAIWGALIAGISFELAKVFFSMYLTAFPSYQIIYGALATIPILFLWVYLSWFIVLVGALITVSIQEYKIVKEDVSEILEEGEYQDHQASQKNSLKTEELES